MSDTTCWTGMEVSWLETLYPDTNNAEIGELLGRDFFAVRGILP